MYQMHWLHCSGGSGVGDALAKYNMHVKESSESLAMKIGPVFIIGAPRSGTTLLQYMLRSHPRISFPTGESHFMIPLYRNSASYGNLRDPDNMHKLLTDIYKRNAEYIDSDLHGLKFEVDVLVEKFCSQNISTVPDVVRGLLEMNAHGEGKVRWGDKTPYYSLHVPVIMEMFPDAQIIHIIRDGRDCALSMLGRRYDLDIHNVYEAAKIWKQYVTAGQAAGRVLGSTKYYAFHYEHLLEDQVTVVKEICRFLGEDFSESVINYKKATGNGKTPLLRKPIQKQNSGKWETEMSQWQNRVFEDVAGDTLEDNDYILSGKRKKPLPELVRMGYGLHQRFSRREVRRSGK